MFPLALCCSLFPPSFRPIHKIFFLNKLLWPVPLCKVRKWLPIQWLNSHIQKNVTNILTPRVLAGKPRRLRRRRAKQLYILSWYYGENMSVLTEIQCLSTAAFVLIKTPDKNHNDKNHLKCIVNNSEETAHLHFCLVDILFRKTMNIIHNK